MLVVAPGERRLRRGDRGRTGGELIGAPALCLDELGDLLLELRLPGAQLGRAGGQRLGVLHVAPALGQSRLGCGETRRLGLRLERRRRERRLAPGEAFLTLGQRALARAEILGGGLAPDLAPPEAAALELAVELLLRPLELALPPRRPVGRLLERRLHACDLPRGVRLHAVALGREVALDLLQAPPLGLQRLDRRPGVGTGFHGPKDTGTRRYACGAGAVATPCRSAGRRAGRRRSRA